MNDVSGGGSLRPRVDDLQFQVEEVWRILLTLGNEYAFRSDLDAVQSELDFKFRLLSDLQAELSFLSSQIDSLQ